MFWFAVLIQIPGYFKEPRTEQSIKTYYKIIFRYLFSKPISLDGNANWNVYHSLSKYIEERLVVYPTIFAKEYSLINETLKEIQMLGQTSSL